MPFIQDTSFKPKLLLRNKHVNTLYRFLFSHPKAIFNRKRIETKDNDFIDLDFSKVKSTKIVIAIHGLEGSSQSNFINSITQTLNQADYDVVVFNMRSCSGEPNRLLSSYHSGKTEDLLEIIRFLENNYNYEQIHIISYSLGANLALKFMGEFANAMPESIYSAVGISAPCNLKGSAEAILKPENKIYMNGFLKTLKEKAIDKAKKFPEANFDIKKIKKASSFYEFDNLVTAPINGFKNADDYWEKASCKQYLKSIKKPSLLISAKDDPFLNEACFPISEAEKNNHFTFIQTLYGGHLGFVEDFNLTKQRWIEKHVLSFIKENS